MLIPNSENSAVLFLDLQQEIIVKSKTVNPLDIRKVSGVLAKLCKLHQLATYVSAVPQGGEFIDEVMRELENPSVRFRSETTAFADSGIVEHLHKTKRKAVILAGVASEIVVQRTAVDALAAGFSVYVAVDACGGISERTEGAAWHRILAAGGATTSVITYAAELAGDLTSTKGSATLGLMYELFKN